MAELGCPRGRRCQAEDRWRNKDRQRTMVAWVFKPLRLGQMPTGMLPPVSHEGLIRGTYQGKAYTGNIVVKVIDDDHWHWTIKGKDADGEAFTLFSKLMRKSD